MNTIKIQCKTNEDKVRNATWPTQLCCRPLVGDSIMSKDGQHNRRIVRVMHAFYPSQTDIGESNYPYLILELAI